MTIERLLFWRDSEPRPGPENMAVDEWLLATAREPLLRVYDWEGSWISLGYFTPTHEARQWVRESEVRLVRRATGGGLVDNIPRILPEGCSAEINRSAWEVPPLFEWLSRKGEVDGLEMYRVFNMGVGLVVILPKGGSGRLGEGEYRWGPFRIGTITGGERGVKLA